MALSKEELLEIVRWELEVPGMRWDLSPNILHVPILRLLQQRAAFQWY